MVLSFLQILFLKVKSLQFWTVRTRINIVGSLETEGKNPPFDLILAKFIPGMKVQNVNM